MATSRVTPSANATGRKIQIGAAAGARASLNNRNYSGSRNGGLWTNDNGAVTGYSPTEDSTITPRKSTGDTISAFVKQRKRAGTKGY